MKIVRSITIASALLATVAFSSPMAFAADSAQVEQDKLMCQHIAQQAVLLMPPFEQQEAFLNTYYQCMNGKGYGPGVAEK